MQSKYANRMNRSLRVECLEDRVPLAGDVTAALSAAGDLTIRGDVHENHLAIIDAGAGKLILQGSNNTTITANGKTGSQAVFNLSSSGLRNVSVDMSSAITASGDVRGRYGADVVAMAGVKVAGNLSVRGSHAGVVTVAGANVKGSATLAFGTGVSSGSGSAAVGSDISLGVTSANTVNGSVAITTGSSHDDVHVAANAIGRNLTLRANAGNDSLSLGVIGKLKVGGALTVDAGVGNNVVVASNADVSGAASVVGGVGVDSVTLGSANALVATTFRGDVGVNLGDGGHNALMVRGKVNAATLNSPSASASTTFAQSLTVTGGAGLDKIGFNGAVVKGNLRVNSGAAADSVLAANLAVLGSTYVTAGAGNDIVALSAMTGSNRVYLRGSTLVDLGDGDDRVAIRGATSVGPVTLNGGAGADVLAVSQSKFGANLSVNGSTGVNKLAFDTASVQMAAGTALKTSAVTKLSGTQLSAALSQSASAVYNASIDAALNHLFG